MGVLLGLIAGAARHLAPVGVLVMYGPFRIGGAHTAPSNAEFDQSLKARDPRWGVRDCEAVVELARCVGSAIRAADRDAGQQSDAGVQSEGLSGQGAQRAPRHDNNAPKRNFACFGK